jgi:hypothetical protein
MKTKVFNGRIQVKEFKEGHAIFEDSRFANLILIDLRTNAFVVRWATIAYDWLGKLLDGRLVEDRSESTIGNVERDGVAFPSVKSQ